MMSDGLVRAFAFALLLCGVAACDLGVLTPYDGPRPAEEDIRAEAAVVRSADTTASGYLSYIVDRTKFVDAGNPHDVNRVVWVSTTDASIEQVRALNLEPGDRTVLSTRYAGEREAAELTEVPNWPGHRHLEYPIGVHHFIAVERVP